MRVALILLTCATAFADTVVVPNAQATAAGNSPITLGSGAIRFQEVIGGGQLSQYPNGIMIIALRLRSTAGGGPVTIASPSAQITLSTTQAYPNTNTGHALPSATYATNIGPDATLVYNGPLFLKSPGCGAPGPCSFDMLIPLMIPFFHNPNNGRLLIDLISAPLNAGTGSLDGVSFTDPTQSTVAVVIGNPAQSVGTVQTVGLVYGLETDTPCVSNDGTYPCTIAGTLRVKNASGSLVGGGGGSGGKVVTTFINDYQNPGYSVSGKGAPLIQASGPAQTSFTGTFDLAAVSSLANLNGARVSMTCGVSANASITMTITTPAGTTNLSCLKMPPGLVSTVFTQVSFPGATSVTDTVTITFQAPGANDTLTLNGFSFQSSIAWNGPTILNDSAGVINGGTNQPGHIVSGSWVAIKGSGFTDPGVTVDWSKADFSKGLPTSLNGVRVLFNGMPGAVWYLIDGATQQINAQAPDNLSGNVTVQVLRNNSASNVATTTAAAVSPGIFSYSLDGINYFPAAVFSDGTYLGDPAQFTGARKAKAGDKVVLFANSLALSPAGVVSVSATTHPVTVTIGSLSFPADFSGLVAPGEFQINITVPSLPTSGDLPITIQVDGQPSQTGLLFPYSN